MQNEMFALRYFKPVIYVPYNLSTIFSEFVDI